MKLIILTLAISVVACTQLPKNKTLEMELPNLNFLWETSPTLLTPESVLHIPNTDYCIVSCIGNTPPYAKDNDGFLAKVDLKGNIINPKWASNLNAPKGMGIFNQKVYVTDIDRVLIFDLNTAKLLQEIPIEGATFLNDLVIDKNGTVYFTDSDQNKAFMLKNGSAEEILESNLLQRINGVFHSENHLYFSSSKSGNVAKMNLNSHEIEVLCDSIFGGDGIMKNGNGYFVSSWNGQVYYLNSLWQKKLLIDTESKGLNAADFEIIKEKNIIIIPTFKGNKLMAYQIN